MSNKVENKMDHDQVAKKSHLDYFKDLNGNQSMSDVTFLCQYVADQIQKFKQTHLPHRVILEIVSPVFKAMLFGSLAERD